LLHFPKLLVVGQYLMMGLELLSPLIWLIRRDRNRYIAVAGLYAFHLMTYCSITIIFLPHLVALTSFLPMERVQPIRWMRSRLERPRQSSESNDTPNETPEPKGSSRPAMQETATATASGE